MALIRRIVAYFRPEHEHDWSSTGYFWLEELLVSVDECSVCHDVKLRSQ